jgi:hypothetical protein
MYCIYVYRSASNFKYIPKPEDNTEEEAEAPEYESPHDRLYHSFEAIQYERQQERDIALTMRQQMEQQECTFHPVRCP